jgi:hypothetical protein
MLTTRLWGALALASAALALPSPATAEQVPPGLAATTTSETGCKEIVVARAARTTSLRPLVPTRYSLNPVNPANPIASRTNVTTYTCDSVAVDGAPAVGAQPTTVVIGSASITARDGAATPGSYILWYGTDNPVLFAKYQRLGFPVSRIQPNTEFSLGETTSRLHWDIAGEGLDYRLDAVGTEATTQNVPSGSNFYYDSPRGDLHWVFTNDARTSNSVINADFSQLQPLAPPFLAQDNLQCVPASLPPCALPTVEAPGAPFTGNYLRGSWTSELTLE